MIRLRRGLRVEDVDGESVVLDATGAEVHRLTGAAVEALRLARVGVAPTDVPGPLHRAMDGLVESGLIEEPKQWTRRKVLIAGGAAWAAASVTTFALADPAAAATMCVGMTPTNPATGMYTANTSYVTGPAGSGMTTYNLLVRAWGGGGGGGSGNVADGGGGGGGGGYARHGQLSVTECTAYTIVVGGGGSGGSFSGLSSNGGSGGGTSSFSTGPSATGGGGGGMAGTAGGAAGAGGGVNQVATTGGAGGNGAGGASGAGGGGSGGDGGSGQMGENSGAFSTGEGGAAGIAGAGAFPQAGATGGTAPISGGGGAGSSPGGGGAGGSPAGGMGGAGAVGAVWVGV